MTCSRELIEGYLDEELDPGVRAEVAEHLARCAACSEVFGQIRDLKAGIRAAAPYYRAPAELRESLRASLRQAAVDEAPPKVVRMPWRGMAIAASLLLVVSASLNVSRFTRPAPANDALAQSILASHIRSLIGTHLMDVPSSDQHTVKPWFNGKLDFSPEVKDLGAQGFPLLGGRVDYLTDRTVAVVIYGRRQHIINLYLWPVADPAGESRFSRNGYNFVHWTSGAMTLWAVSDVSFTDLDQFRNLYAGAPLR